MAQRVNTSQESFRPPFSKGGAVEGAEPSSPSADGEISFRRFSFAKLFSLHLLSQREKRARTFMLLRGYYHSPVGERRGAPDAVTPFSPHNAVIISITTSDDQWSPLQLNINRSRKTNKIFCASRTAEDVCPYKIVGICL